MTQPKAQKEFFIGAMSSSGYVNRMSELTNPKKYRRVYLLKGTPGNGKSTLLKKAFQKFLEENKEPEMIRCSLDSNSLDAVATREISIMDSTSPHVMDAGFVNVVESIVNMGEASRWEDMQPFRDQLIDLTYRKKECIEQATRCLSAAGMLFSERTKEISKYTDFSKIQKSAKRLVEKNIKGGLSASEEIRFLSAYTALGKITLEGTVKTIADRIILIEDEYGATATKLLAEIRIVALTQGCKIISCYHPLYPTEKLEHLFFPDLKLAILSCRKRQEFSLSPDSIISYKRFLTKGWKNLDKKVMTLEKNVATELLNKSYSMLSYAKNIHSEIESIYHPFIDFSKVDDITNRILSEI